jgi:hypothetical protein
MRPAQALGYRKGLFLSGMEAVTYKLGRLRQMTEIFYPSLTYQAPFFSSPMMSHHTTDTTVF